jgi:GtrA-like protein
MASTVGSTLSHRPVAGRPASPRRAAGDRAASAIARSQHPESLGRAVGSFALIGVASTTVYAVLYAALRGLMPGAAANALSLLVTAVGNTATNRRPTFGVQGRASLIRDTAQGSRRSASRSRSRRVRSAS